MRPPAQTDRAFGLMFAAVFAIITVVAYAGFGHTLSWAAGLAVAFLAVALVRPVLLLPLNRLWRHFAGALGAVNNRVLLGAFYLVMVVPLGQVMRLLGKDPMERQNTAGSMWRPVPRKFDADTVDDMF